jgi:hypothetical protein
MVGSSRYHGSFLRNNSLMKLEKVVLQSIKMTYEYILKEGQIISCGQTCQVAQGQTNLQDRKMRK